MRKVLFKAKRKDSVEWVEGSLKIHLIDGDLERKEDEYYITVQWMDKIGKVYRQDYEVIPKTVSQYTGLQDKNCKKIFEEDICKTESKLDGLNIEKVVYKFGAFILITKNLLPSLLKDVETNDIEVIGNIHDNPELLK